MQPGAATPGMQGPEVQEMPLSEPVEALLRMVGEVYLPFLDANDRAFHADEKSVHVELRGTKYAQDTFKYQVKCLAELRRRFAALEGPARERVCEILAKAGGLDVLQTAGT